jgi:arylesterase/paraoxonase
VLADKNTNVLRILLILFILPINHRPSFDPVTGNSLDATKVGANSTIELFQTIAGGDTMCYIRTYANDVIMTPDRGVQWVSDHSFVFTNDKSVKVGIVGSYILV